MNSRAAASIKAVEEHVLADPPDGLLLFIVFGSQARGTETTDSDLDIMYVTRRESPRFYKTVHDTVLGADGGVKAASIFPHTPESVKRDANLYGMPEYGALRGCRDGGSVILYRSKDACGALDGIMAGGVGGCRGDEDGHNRPDACDTAWCARQYLGKSEKVMSDGLSAAAKYGGSADDGAHVGSVCFMMWWSINHAIRACLLHHGIMFPFTRDVRELHGMLPPGSRMPLDFGALEHWYAHHTESLAAMREGRPPRHDYTGDDMKAAVGAARKAHAFASELLARASAPRPAEQAAVPAAS